MSVAKLGKQLVAEIHRRFAKSSGFRKHGNTFSREREGYVELYGIQGSSWNSGEEPWSFYVNVSLRLIDVAPLRETRLTATYAHASGRINQVVQGAPGSFDLTAANLEARVLEIWNYMANASEALPRFIPEVRASVARGYYTFLVERR